MLVQICLDQDLLTFLLQFFFFFLTFPTCSMSSPVTDTFPKERFLFVQGSSTLTYESFMQNSKDKPVSCHGMTDNLKIDTLYNILEIVFIFSPIRTNAHLDWGWEVRMFVVAKGWFLEELYNMTHLMLNGRIIWKFMFCQSENNLCHLRLDGGYRVFRFNIIAVDDWLKDGKGLVSGTYYIFF